MKMTKKKIFVTALVISLVAIISMGTLAWFSDFDSVNNEFKFADSDGDGTPDFKIDVWEVTPDGDDTDGYEYDKILPGDVLVKEPHVENTGDYDQYVRVTVTISDAQAWFAALGTDFDATEVFVGFDATMWDPAHIWNNVYGADPATLGEIRYVLYYDGVLASGDDFTVFESVKIPESLTKEEAEAFGGSFNITVKAEAVQSENIADNAYDAFQKLGA